MLMLTVLLVWVSEVLAFDDADCEELGVSELVAKLPDTAFSLTPFSSDPRSCMYRLNSAWSKGPSVPHRLSRWPWLQIRIVGVSIGRTSRDAATAGSRSFALRSESDRSLYIGCNFSSPGKRDDLVNFLRVSDSASMSSDLKCWNAGKSSASTLFCVCTLTADLPDCFWGSASRLASSHGLNDEVLTRMLLKG